MKLDEDNAENNNQIEVDGDKVDLSVDSVEESVGNEYSDLWIAWENPQVMYY